MPPLLVTGAADRTLRLWNVDTMQRLRVLYKRPAEPTTLAVSRWVQRLAAAAAMWRWPEARLEATS